MTDFEETILRRLEHLETEVRELKSAGSRLYDDLPPDAVVGKDYVAYRFGCSSRAVLRGERGTDKIRRVSNKPLKFIRREVDAAWEKQKKKPIQRRGADERAKAKKRIYSIIKK